MKPLNIIFAGTPDFAAHCLQALLNSEHNIVAVYTQPDRPAGRGKKLQPSPVKTLALDHNIAVEQPLNFKEEGSVEALQAYEADLMVVVAYGLLLPQVVLDAPKLGCINVHASLLPRWRGAAPIQRAIEAGDAESGVCIMQMEAGLDTGPVWSSVSCPITDTETGASLHDKLAALGATALIDALPDITEQNRQPETQDEAQVIYAHKLQKAEAAIDWSLPALAIERKVRAFNSWPVAFISIENQPLRIWSAVALESSSAQPPGHVIKADKEGIEIACGEGSLLIQEVQPSGKRKMAVADLLNSKSHWFTPGKLVGA
ncbi:methionyl-tRNA formyltransferase [Pleionea sp. CnH1-48]|uniref:methionyl-tRNA formyltransferase n=1 Tax=Pleionea sp. CnH1-48 TaxID=2954494 RepID=UPI002096FD84|nr:methionyl-tRNA formyltransferase [Pleionea sp. CnH1-48]MCO7226570.1 methionyl-tRNA formyltransferase [Pleionea sp. CnH1-48]